MAVINEPNEPPSAEKITLKLTIVACFDLGKLLSINEFMAGYNGAKKKPINGKINAANGASLQLVYTFPLATSTNAFDGINDYFALFDYDIDHLVALLK